jgi:hypothetical protein
MRITPLVLASSVCLLTMAPGCGGGEGSGGKPASDPTTAAGPGGATEAKAAEEGGAAETAGDGPSTTTTTAIPEKGELTGVKLGSSSRQEIETKGEGGPKPGGPSTEPGRTRQDIQTIVGSHRDEARACYDKGLESHPGIEGDLMVKWVIDPQGNVTDVAVDVSKSQILEKSVHDCVIGVIKKLRFASSGKGFETRASYPFNFHPRKGPAKPAGAK